MLGGVMEQTMKISTSTSVLTNFLLKEAVDRVVSIGFDGIDVWCGRPHLYRQDYSGDHIRTLGGKIKTAGLRIVSVMPAFFRYPYSITSPLKTVCDDSVRYMMDCIDNARVIGAESVLVVPIKSLADQTPAEAREIFVKNLAKICEYAESKDMFLNIEVLTPKLSGFVSKTEQAVQIIQEIGSDKLGVVLDTGHLNLSGESVESAIETAGELLKQMHINDNNGIEQQNAIPGEGNIDFAQVGNLLEKHGYTGYLTLELGAHYSFDPEPALGAALEKTKELMSK
jgi:protein FrlC